MTDLLKLPVLRSLVPLLIEGADARALLQGQLSSDLRKLTPENAKLASCNSSQGRVQAVMTLLEREEGIFALLPASVLARTLARLRMYVLRARVKFHDDVSRWALAPVTAAQAGTLASDLPQSPGECISRNGMTILRWWSADQRYLLLSPADAVQEHDSAMQDLLWHRADVAAGLPQVYPETHESFVAQMLNLDLLGGISFDKGCYTGQEIIARTYYRGTIKRRMYRFSATCTAPAPGTRVLNGTTHAGEVVDAVIASPGCELLAVVSVDQSSASLSLDGIPDSALTRLALPYSLEPPASQSGAAKAS